MNVSKKSDINRQRLETIIDIAHRLFAQSGYENVGIREICQAAGLSPTQLYRLGVSKQDLLAEVMTMSNADLIRERVEQALNDADVARLIRPMGSDDFEE